MTKNRTELLKEVEKEYLKKDKLLDISIGDTVKVHFKIREGKRERIQIFEGVVIGIKGRGLGKTLTVRKTTFNVGVERVFPLHSPKIESIVLVRRGRVRRAKLYYLRGRRGKSAQVKRYIEKKEEGASAGKKRVESKNLEGKKSNKEEEGKVEGKAEGKAGGKAGGKAEAKDIKDK